jgi:hypothetical protein
MVEHFAVLYFVIAVYLKNVLLITYYVIVFFFLMIVLSMVCGELCISLIYKNFKIICSSILNNNKIYFCLIFCCIFLCNSLKFINSLFLFYFLVENFFQNQNNFFLKK